MEYRLELIYKDGRVRSLHGYGGLKDVAEVLRFLLAKGGIKWFKVHR